MKIGVTGYYGNVGSRLVRQGCQPLKFDVTNKDAVSDVLYVERPDVIIYCAGLTDVDECEKDRKKAVDVNAKGVSNIVDVYSGKLIYISTDHVFDGQKFLSGGYSESNRPNPINRYGMTKLAGELMAKNGRSDSRIIRTSKLFTTSGVRQSLESAKEVTTVLKRSFVHVEHFINGLRFVLDNWEKIPTILNIAGDSVYSYYDFYYQAAIDLGIEPKFTKRTHYSTSGFTPRPQRGGLNVKKAQRLGVPIYNIFEGLNLDD